MINSIVLIQINIDSFIYFHSKHFETIGASLELYQVLN